MKNNIINKGKKFNLTDIESLECGRNEIEDYLNLGLGARLDHRDDTWTLTWGVEKENGVYNIVMQDPETFNPSMRSNEVFFIKSPTDPNSVLIAGVVDSGEKVAHSGKNTYQKYKTIYFGRDKDNTYRMIDDQMKAANLEVLCLKSTFTSRRKRATYVVFQVHF